MAEDNQDDSQKTEEPTEKKLREAREKGQVAKSQEVSHWFAILGLTMIVGFLLPGMLGDITQALLPLMERPHDIVLGSGGIAPLLAGLALDVAGAVFLPALLLIAAALLSGFLQTGFNVSAQPLMPKLEKVSIFAGFKRLFSSRALMEFAKGLFKLSIVSGAIAMVLWPAAGSIPDSITYDMVQLLDLLELLSFQVLLAALSVMTVIAAADYSYQRFQHMKQLRMSKQDLKDEYKQTEGDPMVKARLRQIRTERARQRMMTAVPEADVVITNPTHFAVALKYEHGVDAAPRVTAKGADHIAKTIRELAEEHKVPLVENPPLARALYASVDVEQHVPPEHYQAVAEIIGYVMRLKGKMPGEGTQP